MEKPCIKLSLPDMGGTEMQWVEQAYRDNWVVPLGPNVDEFERRLASYLGKPNVVALSAGTAAIHLALVMLGVGPGDEVVCQSFTFSASVNPVKYQGASPVFVDSEPGSWNMSPEWLEEAIVDRKRKTGKYPKAIIPVLLYGMPADMDRIMAVASRYGIPVVEDSAEALGSEYKGRKCGTIGEYGCLSFNGNKVITTSGGGALVCPSAETAARVKFYATQARENRPYYYHEVIGYNYRMSNICAGIGCGQMDVLRQHVDKRRAIHDFYTQSLSDVEGVEVKQNPSDDVRSNFWLSTVLFDEDSKKTPEDARRFFAEAGVETRWLWRPMHMQPVYKDAPYYGGDCCERLYRRGLCLPSGSGMTDNDLEYIVDVMKAYLKK